MTGSMTLLEYNLRKLSTKKGIIMRCSRTSSVIGNCCSCYYRQQSRCKETKIPGMSVEELLTWQSDRLVMERRKKRISFLPKGWEEATVEYPWLIEILAHKVGIWITSLLGSEKIRLCARLDGMLSPQNRHIVLLQSELFVSPVVYVVQYLERKVSPSALCHVSWPLVEKLKRTNMSEQWHYILYIIGPLYCTIYCPSM